MHPLIQLKTTLPLLIALALLCFALLPRAEAVVPPPDGGYPGFTTAEGNSALQNLTTGVGNTAAGWHSLFANTTGNLNTAIGAGTLLFNTGDNNTATGALALLSNTTGANNTATGFQPLFSNTTGGNNTANGVFALFSNTNGTDNTATGVDTLMSSTTASANVAYGDFTLLHNITGSDNTAMGYVALLNATGSHNIGLGNGAGINLTTGDSNIDIDSSGVAGESSTIRIGNLSHTRAFIAGIADAVTGGTGVPVLVDVFGQMGTASSSARFKKEIKPMERASEAILGLKPVTFHYKSDNTNTPQFGLIAEEVAEVNPDLVVRDKNGEIYTVRYDAVNAMLLNEFLKEHRKVEEQEKTIVELKSGMTALAATVKEQAAQIQKVSAQLEASKPAPQVVNNNQ